MFRLEIFREKLTIEEVLELFSIYIILFIVEVFRNELVEEILINKLF